MVKHFFKVFFLSFFILLIGLFGAIYLYIKIDNPVEEIISEEIEDDSKGEESNSSNDKNNEELLTPLQKAIKDSKRINVLLSGLEGSRTDTIMLASYDIDSKKADLISIPRDTYYERKEYTNAEMQKINAVYQSDGIDGLEKAVQSILPVPIHKYVLIDYEAVIRSVDIIGGVDIDIPFAMSYHDPYSNPPLSIEFQPGYQLLDGQASLEYLRFRKNDDRSMDIGDVGRIKLQRIFIERYIKKVLGFKLPTVVKEVYSYIDTDFSLTEIIDLCGYVVGFNTDDLNIQCIPYEGKTIDGLSFVIPDYEESMSIVYSMYGIGADKKSE